MLKIFGNLLSELIKKKSGSTEIHVHTQLSWFETNTLCAKGKMKPSAQSVPLP